MFYLSGVGISFFLGLLLLSKRKKTLADQILLCWLIIITLHLLLFYFRKFSIYPELLGTEIPIPLLHGPFLYLYTLSLTNRSSSIGISLLHFLPAFGVLIYIASFLFLPVDQKIFVYENKGLGYETFGAIKSVLIIISGVFYVFASSFVLSKHRASIVNQFSNADKINLQWLQYLIYWIGIIWLLVIFTNDDWVFAAAVLFVVFIGFFGIRQVGIFHANESPIELKNSAVSSIEDEEIQEKRKYQKSGLDARNLQQTPSSTN
ncbi:MAG: hypothetical protein QM734_05485 [Cyclobacteriaceae bacterium]